MGTELWPFSKMLRAHEQLRAVLNHRINSGTMSLALLHRRTHIGVSHLSNWRLGRRALSIDSMSAIARALGFDAELVPLADPDQIRLTKPTCRNPKMQVLR
jgi:transcriptional regulator with XRE-family HTH domain